MDLNMPLVSEFDLMEAYQHLPADKTAKIKVVVLTISQLSKDVERLKTLGIKNVLNKPLTEEISSEWFSPHFPEDILSAAG